PELAILLPVGIILAVVFGLAVAVFRQASLFTRALEAKVLARCESVAGGPPPLPKPLAQVARAMGGPIFHIKHSPERVSSLADDQAHALRTPLATIKVALPVLLRGVPAGDPQMARAAKAIERAIEDMIVTVNSARREARAIAALLAGGRSRVELEHVVLAAVDDAR